MRSPPAHQARPSPCDSSPPPPASHPCPARRSPCRCATPRAGGSSWPVAHGLEFPQAVAVLAQLLRQPRRPAVRERPILADKSRRLLRIRGSRLRRGARWLGCKRSSWRFRSSGVSVNVSMIFNKSGFLGLFKGCRGLLDAAMRVAGRRIPPACAWRGTTRSTPREIAEARVLLGLGLRIHCSAAGRFLFLCGSALHFFTVREGSSIFASPWAERRRAPAGAAPPPSPHRPAPP